MKDTIFLGNGESSRLSAWSGMPQTWEAFRDAMISGNILVDITRNPSGVQQAGTPLNKQTLLSDSLANRLELSENDATVSNAIEKLTFDTDWQTLTLQAPFVPYQNNATSFAPQVRRIGSIVILRGMVSIDPITETSSYISTGTERTMLTLPSGFRPSGRNIVKSYPGRDQGLWTFILRADGTVTASRYNVGGALVDSPAGVRLAMHCVFFIG